MRMIRLISALVASACLAVSLFGCGSSSKSDEGSPSCAVEVGDVINLGSVTFDSCTGGTYSGDPEWLVIRVSGDEALVITEDCVDLGSYDESSADWETSDIRQFLNGEFYEGLEDETKQLVREKSISDTEAVDKVFLLGPDEANVFLWDDKYQAEYPGCKDEANKPYTFWKSVGADDFLVDMPWWLRIPDSEGDAEFSAYSGGVLFLPFSEGGSCSTWRGIRPAMWVELPVGWDAGGDDDAAESVEMAGVTESESVDEGSASADGAVPTASAPSLPDGVISWEDASAHVGEAVTVDGEVMGASYASGSNGGPTFIDLGADYPDPSRVSVVVWGEDRHRFPGAPESMYLGKRLRVTGEIYLYNGACNIKVTSPSQIEVL